jgi:hypothetical protein
LNALLPLFETSGLIIQKYIENTGTTLKFFNIGSEIIVLTERSNIPDFVEIQNSKDRKKDKSTIAKILLDLNSAEFRDDKLVRKKIDYPKVLETVVKKIGQKLNLDIFGVDMIVDKTGNYYIIDVNDFPGFRGVENIGNVIVNYIQNKKINESKKITN